MNEQPYHNEPGFEKEHHSGESNRYNQIISHETVRVAVCEPLENSSVSLKNCPPSLIDVMRNSFHQYYDHYQTVCEQLKSLQNAQMVDPFGEKRGCFDPQSLSARLRTLKETIKIDNTDEPMESESSDESPQDDCLEEH